MKFIIIGALDFDQKGELLKSGVWIILNGGNEKTEIIFTELSQCITGPNFGIYPNTENKGIQLYNNSKLIKTYSDTITKSNLTSWILNNSS